MPDQINKLMNIKTLDKLRTLLRRVKANKTKNKAGKNIKNWIGEKNR